VTIREGVKRLIALRDEEHKIEQNLMPQIVAEGSGSMMLPGPPGDLGCVVTVEDYDPTEEPGSGYIVILEDVPSA